MDRHSITWTGAMPAITTPFTKAGAVDHDGLSRNIKRLVAAGATGVVAAGCTGEFWTLSREERRAIGVTTRGALGPDLTCILGCAAITPSGVLEALHDAKEAGADAGLVMPPFFAHLTKGEIIAHFEAVAAASPLPIVLYNIPGNAGNALTPDIVDVLADLDPVVAIKESSGDWMNFNQTIDRVRDRIRVFCGPSSTIGVPAMLAGCDGLIDCFPNVWDGCLDLWTLHQEGRMEEAWAYQARAQALTHLFTSGGRTLYPATKAAMDHLGLPGGGKPRAPLQPLKGPALTELIDGLDRILGRKTSAA
ncbi:dihydrodipicolinate synthase family protein [Cognatishimia sp. F0-27]|uniref:dihydrodipicolinate synthase family protein n=1 Tax=Cognatishimia sp. F0-27 TaxID=2816855 RepID=UPI001D0C18A2|nr:dihydrodipicolinate synthase family protein [Cognatishimia sp. F0-27]MCC1493124.1 dihydrodipicolinate synthase family protein [Cognatishimia sp. F0-27]